MPPRVNDTGKAVSRLTRLRAGLLACLCCLVGGTWGQTDAPASPVARTQDGLRALLRSARPTPLDALTPYGRRELIRQMSWRDGKLVGFGSAPLIRELDHAQLAAVLRFLDSADYLPMLGEQLVGPPLRLPAPSARWEQAIVSLRRAAQEDDARRVRAITGVTTTEAAATARRYKELFGARAGPATLAARPTGDLLVLFDAAALTAGRSPGTTALDDMLRLHGEFVARGVATGRTIDRNVFDALLAAHRFDQARAFAATRAHLAGVPVPLTVDRLGPDYQGRSAFEFDAARNVLTRVALPAPVGSELVMVVGAGCHNSANALAALHADAALQGRLQGMHLTLVTAPNAAIETGLLTRWNAAKPTMPMRVPYSAHEWRAIGGRGVPAFYLLRNGELVDLRIGWPANGKALLGELLDAAAR